MNRDKCNGVNGNIISSANDTDYSYGSQDDNTTFKKTDIDYTKDVHSDYMDTVMHIIYLDSYTPCDTQRTLRHGKDNPLKMLPPKPKPQLPLKPPIMPMALLQSSASFSTTSSYDCGDELDGTKIHHFDI